MGWAKFDDRRHTNGKLIAAGLAANGLDANGITFCAANETDGFIPDDVMPVLAPTVTARQRTELAAVLVKVGRWVRDDDGHGWWIHDFLGFHPSRASLEEKRAKDRDRKSTQQRTDTGRFQPESGRKAQGIRQESVRTPSDPVPSRPVPSRPLGGSPVSEPSSSNDVGPEEEAEPSDLTTEALAVLVERRLTRRDGPPIQDLAKWRQATLTGVTRQFGDQAAHIAAAEPGHTPTSLADALEPTTKPLSPADATQAAQRSLADKDRSCLDCHGTGWRDGTDPAERCDHTPRPALEVVRG